MNKKADKQNSIPFWFLLSGLFLLATSGLSEPPEKYDLEDDDYSHHVVVFGGHLGALLLGAFHVSLEDDELTVQQVNLVRVLSLQPL